MIKKNNITRNILYNTIGTTFYFFCQWLTTILVVRLSGYEDAGTLSLAISTTNIFYFIAMFGVRNFQVSDIDNKYSDNQYIYSRIVTISLAMFAFFIIMFFLKFNKKTFLCCIFYLIYKFAEAFSDVLFGVFQRYSDYKAIVISYTLKGLCTLIAFTIGLYITNDLVIAIIAVAIAYILVIIIYDKSLLENFANLKIEKFNPKRLLLLCFPLMLYGLILPCLNFITRYAVERATSTEILGYYSSVSMVFVVMSTLMGSVFISIVPTLSKLFSLKKFESLRKMILIAFIGIALFGIAACIGAYILGDFAFSLLFGKQILDYMYLLIPTIISSIVLTYNSFFSSALISFCKNQEVLYINLISLFVCTLSIFPFIDHFGLLGAIWSLTFSLGFTTIILIIRTIRIIYKEK